MLDGETMFLVGDEVKTARTGDFVVVPRDTRHAFRVDGETARFLNGYKPAFSPAPTLCVMRKLIDLIRSIDCSARFPS
jgi:hypothetical protein